MTILQVGSNDPKTAVGKRPLPRIQAARGLPTELGVILDAVLEVGRYSVRQVWDRVREQGISRQKVFERGGLFEAAGVVKIPANRLGRRKVLVENREEAVSRLRAYLEKTT